MTGENSTRPGPNVFINSGGKSTFLLHEANCIKLRPLCYYINDWYFDVQLKPRPTNLNTLQQIIRLWDKRLKLQSERPHFTKNKLDQLKLPNSLGGVVLFREAAFAIIKKCPCMCTRHRQKVWSGNARLREFRTRLRTSTNAARAHRKNTMHGKTWKTGNVTIDCDMRCTDRSCHLTRF